MDSQVAQVLSTIRSALSINQAERQAAETSLQTWEAEAAPGFVYALIRIIEECSAVDEVRARCFAPPQRCAAPPLLFVACAAALLIQCVALSRSTLSCMHIPSQRNQTQPTRLLAAVIAKNTVGSSWRKTLGTREWSRVPLEEKAMVREAVLRLLLSDPSDRCGLGGGGWGGGCPLQLQLCGF